MKIKKYFLRFIIKNKVKIYRYFWKTQEDNRISYTHIQTGMASTLK
jgi:hypothetical protein